MVDKRPAPSDAALRAGMDALVAAMRDNARRETRPRGGYKSEPLREEDDE